MRSTADCPSGARHCTHAAIAHAPDRPHPTCTSARARSGRSGLTQASGAPLVILTKHVQKAETHAVKGMRNHSGEKPKLII
eukprot:4749749-Prymnesium_polylepis.1